MQRRTVLSITSGLATCALALGLLTAPLTAQRITPADLAAAISGTWKINLDLSPQFKQQGGGRQGAAGGFSSPFSQRGTTALALQRGGRGGGGGGGGAAPGPADPREMAGQQALRALQSVGDTLTIAATADSVSFTDPRGTRTYAVDNKNVRLDVGNGAELTTKARWDGRSLRQEFIYGETKVSHQYELSRDGKQIEFTMRIDNFGGGVGRQAEAVYDKQ
jgi:hypothetical protein